MKLALGRIGSQEAVSAAAAAMSVSAIFTIDSAREYSEGNLAYVTIPLGAAAALGAFLFIVFAMKRSGANDLTDLCEAMLGKAAVFPAIIAAALLVFSAWELMFRFAVMLNTFVYRSSKFAPVVVWVTLCPAIIAFMGFECVGRVGKIVGAASGVLFLLGLAGASGGFEAYRLYPIPVSEVAPVISNSLEASGRCFPALLALLAAAPAMQGNRRLRLAGVLAAAIAAFLGAASQLCIGMAYTGEDLSKMYMPLFRLNMVLIKESYWFRLDKLSLFLWLTASAIGAALYIYAASLMITRSITRYDVRPAVVSSCAVLALAAVIAQTSGESGVEAAAELVRRYSWLALPLFMLPALASLIKGRKTENEKA